MLHRAATVAAVMVGTGAGRPLRPLTIHLDFGIVEFALLGQAGSRRKPSNSSEERASGKYWELLESEEPPAGVEPATY